MKRVSLFLGVFSVLLLSACGGGQNAGGAGQMPPQQYPTEVLDTTTVTLVKTYPAIIKGQEDIEIRPRVDGFIDKIHIDEGSVVRKGQILFSINSPQSVQALESAKASVVNAEALLATAELNVTRMRPLAEKKIISQVQLDTYENQYKSAQASVNTANATLAQAQAAIGWASVTSPVDGIVGTIPFRQGSLVNSANVLTTIANTGNVFAYFSLNEKELMDVMRNYPGANQAEKIKNMPPVTLTLADGSVYSETGRIETISGVVNTTTGSANFRAEFPNKNGELRSGTSGKVSLPRRVSGVFEIPQKATFSQQDKVLVYKVQGDSVLQAIISVDAMPGGQNYAVTGGLEKGDRIVTDGVATLTNGKKIKVD